MTKRRARKTRRAKRSYIRVRKNPGMSLLYGIGGFVAGVLVDRLMSAKTTPPSSGAASGATTGASTGTTVISAPAATGLFGLGNASLPSGVTTATMLPSIPGLNVQGVPYLQATRNDYNKLAKLLMQRAAQQGVKVTHVIPYGMPLPSIF